MAALPPPPPEARLIERRRKAMSLSMRQAAHRAGFSAALWAKIEHGYDQVARDIAIPYAGTADKVARAARVLGITASELAEADRRDAAAALAAMAPAEPPRDDKQVIADLRERLAALEDSHATMERRFRELQRQGHAGSEEDEDDEDEEGGHPRTEGGRQQVDV